ncbi:MAG: glycosyltransferase [Ruminococcus sp.]|nr:glycosyltransferase [Ruminococcus sp.]
MIKTTVIIPVYNTSPYLEECITSVFDQTQKEIEVIAINDGSTDDSYDKLLKLQKKYSDLIVLSQENHGLGYTRNVGIKSARGKYIYFLDSDDYIIEDTLETCYKYASENNLDIVLFDALNFQDSNERTPILPNFDDRHEAVKERNAIYSGIDFMKKYYMEIYEPSACFVYCSLAFLKENNVKFLPRVYFEDNEFHCRIMTLANRVMYIPRMFYQRRCRNDSITMVSFNQRKIKDYLEVINAITELKTLNDGKGWCIVRKINQSLLIDLMYVCYKNHLYSQNKTFLIQIIKAWIKMLK